MGREKSPKNGKKPRSKQVYPRGWNKKRVQDVIDFYDTQSADEEAAEYEAAMTIADKTMMLVPTELVPAIQRLIKSHGT